MSAKRNRIDSRIRQARNKTDKISVALHGVPMTEHVTAPVTIARDYHELKDVDPQELVDRLKREMRGGKQPTVRSESEYNTLRSVNKRLWTFARTAMRNWTPESFEQLARAMRRVAKTKGKNAIRFDYADPDAMVRAVIVANDGNISAAALARRFYPKEDQESARVKVQRIKDRLTKKPRSNK